MRDCEEIEDGTLVIAPRERPGFRHTVPMVALWGPGRPRTDTLT